MENKTVLLKNCKIWSIAKKNPGRRGVGAKKTLPFNRGRGGEIVLEKPMFYASLVQQTVCFSRLDHTEIGRGNKYRGMVSPSLTLQDWTELVYCFEIAKQQIMLSWLDNIQSTLISAWHVL